MRHLKTILDTYRDGGHLSDDELVALRDAMDKLDELCSLNPMFYLTGNYARKVADDCRDFIRHRTAQRQREQGRQEFAEAMESVKR